MKKIFLLLIVTVFTIVSFNSCKSEDENNTNPLVGTWKILTFKGADVSAENSHTVFSSSGVLYNYSFEDGCVIDVSTYTVNGNKIITKQTDGLSEEITYSISGDVLTVSYVEGEETITSTAQRVSSIPEACNFGNDTNLVDEWTLTNRIEDGFDSENPDYENCDKNTAKLTINSNGTFTLNGYDYNVGTDACTPRTENGTWKTLNGKIVVEITGQGILEFKYSIIGSVLQLDSYEEIDGKTEVWVIQKFTNNPIL